MKRPAPLRSRSAAGFTLIEILVAASLSLLLLGAVVAMFGAVGGAITDSRSMLEAADKLRLTAERLQMDLAGATATMNPPRKPENNEGYFEIIEGPVGPLVAPSAVAVNTDNSNSPDPTVGDFDDILMFTTRSTGRPFVGRCANVGSGTIQSDVAEVAWFVRGRTLHRRVLLVAPSVSLSGVLATGFYANYDLSARAVRGAGGNFLGYTPNTLGDLTRRECRFAHCAATGSNSQFPFDVRNWYWTVSGSSAQFPTLPTLNECSSPGWIVDTAPTVPITSLSALDFWTNNPNYRVSDSALAGGGTRVADDIILTNVIGFDVKVWDPLAGAYVDLGNSGAAATNRFASANSRPVATGTGTTMSNVYDTWSTHYESVPVPGLTGAGRSTNGLDDTGNGIVDSDAEKLTSPPYPYPLRGIQVKIRTFDPDSKQPREATVVQDFLPQ
jgi:type II secretory pathway component PulJ